MGIITLKIPNRECRESAVKPVFPLGDKRSHLKCVPLKDAKRNAHGKTKYNKKVKIGFDKAQSDITSCSRPDRDPDSIEAAETTTAGRHRSNIRLAVVKDRERGACERLYLFYLSGDPFLTVESLELEYQRLFPEQACGKLRFHPLTLGLAGVDLDATLIRFKSLDRFFENGGWKLTPGIQRDWLLIARERPEPGTSKMLEVRMLGIDEFVGVRPFEVEMPKADSGESEFLGISYTEKYGFLATLSSGELAWIKFEDNGAPLLSAPEDDNILDMFKMLHRNFLEEKPDRKHFVADPEFAGRLMDKFEKTSGYPMDEPSPEMDGEFLLGQTIPLPEFREETNSDDDMPPQEAGWTVRCEGDVKRTLDRHAPGGWSFGLLRAKGDDDGYFGALFANGWPLIQTDRIEAPQRSCEAAPAPAGKDKESDFEDSKDNPAAMTPAESAGAEPIPIDPDETAEAKTENELLVRKAPEDDRPVSPPVIGLISEDRQAIVWASKKKLFLIELERK